MAPPDRPSQHHLLHGSSPNLTLEALQPLVQTALDDYQKAIDGPSPLATLLWFRQECQQEHRSPQQVTNRILLAILHKLQLLSEEDATLIERRFFDGETMETVAHTLNVSSGYIYILRKRALARFTNVLLEEELARRAQQQQKWSARLDTATYVELFGVEETQARLYAAMFAEGPPWLVQLEGLGGSGKTSLADAVTRQVIESGRFVEIGWVSVQPVTLAPAGTLIPRSSVAPTVEGLLRALVQQLLPTFPFSADSDVTTLSAALANPLKTYPHLIVIDNAEAIADRAGLAAQLEQLSNPTRFLLTSRVALPTLQPLLQLVVPPLSATAAETLLRTEAGWHQLTNVTDADAATIKTIYRTIGGNPLALRLILGLARHYTLSTIIDRLERSNDRQIDQLYRFIFAESWQLLDEAARDLLLYMPLAHSSGEELNWIVTVTEKDATIVFDAMTTLVNMNLVNVHRERPPFRYSIHPITRTFLLNDAINWRD